MTKFYSVKEVAEIIDDPYLPSQVYQAGKKVNWSLRELVIARCFLKQEQEHQRLYN
ncbi:hypothetical protein BACPU_17200 [Bacillus pumilus]|nr:hypothetical protein BACPU_17200 [Bacillus pumilus]